MASDEPENNSRKKPANDSIDELLDGMPADPILPKKRARPADIAGPPSSQNRRSDDKVIVREGTDPRERARLDAESARRQSSTFGTSFLGPNATRQKLVVGVVMMLGVLGIYAFVRTMTRNAAPQNVQNTSNSTTPVTTHAAPLPTAEALPPAATTAAASVAASSSATVGAAHHSRLRSDAHAAPSSTVAQPASPPRSATFSGL